MEKTEKLFKNPPAAYRGAPFWSWNGKLDKQEILRQLDVLEDMGMGGYFCHSRTGLITEYLGEEWFDLINTCADTGEAKGMETWLYDEDRWPSGTAGGMVTKNPAYRLHYLRLTILPPGAGFTFGEDTVAAFTADVEGFSFTNKQRITSPEEAAGKTMLLFTVEEMAKESFYNGYTYVDTMNKEATEEYIRITHEKYTEKCGDRLGRSIQGIFTDEPHRGAVLCGFSLSNHDPYFITPYPKDLFVHFEKAYGFDLKDYLPELFLQKDGEKLHPVKWQYMALLQQLFIDHFFKPINAWCKQNNMQLTGHVLHEDTLTCQAAMIGSVMRAYEYMEVPGVDVLGEHNYNYWIVKQIQSAARQLGKKRLLSELYGCTGWHMDMESHKAVGDWQALFGINFRCQHLSWYTMLGEAKRDYPASIFHQSAWYPQYRAMEDYFSRIHVLSGLGEPACRVLVVNPVESIWALIYPGWSHSLATVDGTAAHLETIYKETFHALNGAKIDFDYGDEDYLARLASVEMQNGKTVLRVGQAVYEKVLVTGVLTMRASTLSLLKEFAQKGGLVVCAGDAPAYIDAQKSDAFSQLPAAFVSAGEMLSALQEKPWVQVTDGEGNDIPEVFAQVRKNGEETVIQLLNINREKSYPGARVQVNVPGFVERWDARTGEIDLLSQGKAPFVWDFTPSGELLLVITPENKNRKAYAAPQILSSKPAGESFAYRLHEPNICVLDTVDYKINDGPWVTGQEVLQADRQIRKKLGLAYRGGMMLQPWFAGKQARPELCDLTLKYSFSAEKLPAALTFVCETPWEFAIRVNGQEALTLTDGYWADTCFKLHTVDTAALKTGKNEITFTTRFREDMNLEAAYLLGDFGVYLRENTPVLADLPPRLIPGSVVKQGLPFYGAGISYYVPLPSCAPGQKLLLHAQDYDAACLQLKTPENVQTVFAQPYTVDATALAGQTAELQYILTRRNTFGPLHLPHKKVYWYGPTAFVSEGENFKEEYQLLPQGMTGALEILEAK